MASTLRPEALIATARKLVPTGTRGRPRQADLRRALSTAYYAMFHALASECANGAVGKSSQANMRKAWAQVYRALNHSRVKAVCSSDKKRVRDAYGRFPDSVRAFGDIFVDLQKKRHAADYDPLMEPVFASSVLADIDSAERAIVGFAGAAKSDRRAFCVFVMHDLRD